MIESDIYRTPNGGFAVTIRQGFYRSQEFFKLRKEAEKWRDEQVKILEKRTGAFEGR